MVTRMIAVIITTTVTEKIPIKIDLRSREMRTCQSIKTGIEITVRVVRDTEKRRRLRLTKAVGNNIRRTVSIECAILVTFCL